MTRLHHDFESRSKVDLRVCGLDIYARHPSTKVLMCSWAIDDGPVRLWQPILGEPEPKELREARLDPHVEKHAFNAGFERKLWRFVLQLETPGVWRCSQVLARYMSLPDNLFAATRIVNPLDASKQKGTDGMRLIRKFSMPNKPTKARTWFWNDWYTDPEDWALFGEYCIQDTVSERAFYARAKRYDMPPHEWALWELDQRINDRGLPINIRFAQAAFDLAEQDKRRLKQTLVQSTGLANPMSQQQFLAWARERGYPFRNLQKGWVAKAIDQLERDDPLRDVLAMRVKAGRNSPAKYQTVVKITADDGRARHLYQFMGAQRTGRWSAKKFQPHNLARILKRFKKRLEQLVIDIESGDFYEVEFWHGSVVDTVSNTVRCAIQAPDGYILIVCDLNAIENRTLGWLARCPAINEVFERGLDPYKAFAAQFYGKPYDEVTPQERDENKPPVLGCGYGLGGGHEEEDANGDIMKTGLWGYAEALGVKLSKETCHKAVKGWREIHPEVVQFWYDLDDAAYRVVVGGERAQVGHLTFDKKGPMLRMILPSGRCLHYVDPKYRLVKFRRAVVDDNGEPVLDPDTGEPLYDEWERTVLTYMGVHQKTGKWTRLMTRGAKFCEQACQAVSRDVLGVVLTRCEERGFELVGHTHDEAIACEDIDLGHTYEEMHEAFVEPIDWAPDLVLGAAGYTSKVYKKD